MSSIPSSHADILGKEGFAHLCELGPSGEPQSHPVWYAYRDDTVLVSTTEGRQKLHNVRRDPRVSLSIQDPADPYRYIELRGEVTEISPDQDDEFIDYLAGRYLDEDSFPGKQVGDERVVLHITPAKINTKG